MSQPITWHQASLQFMPGDKVIFITSYDIFPEVLVPEGAIATVVKNSLNNLCRALVVRPDDQRIAAALEDWDGTIWLSPGPDREIGNREPAWLAICPVIEAQP